MKRPIVELSDCILCEVCVVSAPAVFKLNDAGFIEVTEMQVYPENEIDEAIKNCPASCIFWEDSQ